jgi:hypothetical protein
MGQGPVTGRGLGFCTGYESAGFKKGAGYRSGRRFGMGRGMPGYPQAPSMTKEDEIRLLKSQSDELVRSQKEIERRLNQLEKEG